MITHTPVLSGKVIDFLTIDPEGIYVDTTLGLGGHAIQILNKLSKSGLLIGIDCDIQAIEITRQKLSGYNNVKFVNDNFSNLKPVFDSLNISKINGILFDLGVSSLHLDATERGFSFQSDSNLDMRMNQSMPMTAADIINTFPEAQLKQIFSEFGELYGTGKLIHRIIEKRKLSKINSTLALVSIIKSCFPGYKMQMQAVRKVFMALRIYVNNELDNLKNIIGTGIDYLKPDGIMVIISYHSLEDRIVKHSFRKFASDNIIELLTSKPVIPETEEINENSRAHSAKLRAVKKI